MTDQIIAPVWLSLHGVEVGMNCRFKGLPMAIFAPGANIIIEDEVSINSRANNPLGVIHPTTLTTLESDSFNKIGKGSGLSGVSIVARSTVTIGENVLVGADACIWDTDFHPLSAAKRRINMTQDAKTAPITIDDEAFIGSRAIILKGVNISRCAVIGAGAVMTKDVEAGSIVGGNPACVIGSLLSLEEFTAPAKGKQSV